MHFYSFHIGDYATHTTHLEPLEDLAYRRMLDAYYLREQPLPADVATLAKLIRMRGHLAEVQAVLDEFFVLADGGWRQRRCDEQIAGMQDKQSKARAAALASVNSRKAAKAARQAQDGGAVPHAEPPVDADATDAERTFNQTATNVQPPIPSPIPQPPPIPLPDTGGEGVGSSARVPDAPIPPVPLATRAGLVCRAIRRAGVADANPQHPELRVLIKRGAGEDFFAALAAEAVQRGKGRFHYLLAMAKARMAEAAALAQQPLQVPDPAPPAAPGQVLSFAAQDSRTAMARWEELTGRLHPGRPPDLPLPPWAGPAAQAGSSAQAGSAAQEGPATQAASTRAVPLVRQVPSGGPALPAQPGPAQGSARAQTGEAAYAP